MTPTTETAPRSYNFLDGTATILVSRTQDEGGVSVIETAMPAGSMPPPHIHDEDEGVYVLDGRVTFFVGDETVRAGQGDKVSLPRGVPHTYRVESRRAARWASVTSPGRYEEFVREVGTPIALDGPAEPSGLTTLAELVAFTTAAARNGIEIVGAPGSLPGRPKAAERTEGRPSRVGLALRPLSAPLAAHAA
jgi:quercetin dioxygenase-like cupin family protein